MPERPRLAVLVDGKPMPEEQARELWTRFSQHMDEHHGDTAGFAAREGWVNVRPEYVKGQAVLLVQTKEGAPLPAVSPKPPASSGRSRSPTSGRASPRPGSKRRPRRRS